MAAKQQMSVVACDYFSRVCPRTGNNLEPGSLSGQPSIRLSAGRGEFASFQVVVGPFARANKGKQGEVGKNLASVKVGKLSGPGEISPQQFDLFAEWYVFSGKPPAPRKGPAPQAGPAAEQWAPDGLLPLSAFGGKLPLGVPGNDVPGQHYQGLWVDLYVPKDAKPGDYAGELAVTVEGQTHRVGIELAVDAFVAPEQLNFPLLMNNYVDTISSGWRDLRDDPDRHSTARYLKIERTFWQMAHDHNAVFYYLPYTHSGYVYPTFAPELTGGGPDKKVKSWAAFDRHFGPYFDGSAFKSTRRGPTPVARFFLPISLDWPASFLKWGRPGYADEFRAVGRQMADHFKAKNWTGTAFDLFLNHKQRFKLYPWDCEEVRFPEDNEIHRYFRTLWEGTLDHKTTAPVRFDYTNGSTWTVDQDIRSDLAEFTDVFICQSLTTAINRERTAELQRQGTEFCLCGGGATVADSLRAWAWWPLQFWMWGGNSFMVWLSLGWGEDAWRDLPGGGRTLLAYPGDDFNIDSALPSLRLKVLRQVLQTIERFAAASDGVPGGTGKIPQTISDAMGIAKVADWFPTPPEQIDGSEEPPVAGWRSTTVEQFKRLEAVAREVGGK